MSQKLVPPSDAPSSDPHLPTHCCDCVCHPAVICRRFSHLLIVPLDAPFQNLLTTCLKRQQDPNIQSDVEATFTLLSLCTAIILHRRHICQHLKAERWAAAFQIAFMQCKHRLCPVQPFLHKVAPSTEFPPLYAESKYCCLGDSAK